MNKSIKNVLIIDDNPSDATLAKFCIEKLGLNPIIANDGFSALELVGQYQFDLFIVDLQLPKMSGLDLLKRLNAITKDQKKGVLVMSARSRPHDIELSIRAGAKDYVVKPIDLMVFETKVKNLISAQKEEWAEYQITNKESAVAQIKSNAEIISISEVGMTISSKTKLEKGQILEIESTLLASSQIKVVSVRIDEPMGVFNSSNYYKTQFIGLKEEQMKQIRILCKALWAQTQQKNQKEAA